ncbi:MAG: copper resistance protein CopC [Solibacillus sp.]
MNKWFTTASASLLALTVSTTAFAHSHLGGSTPADGDIVTAPLEEIVLNFDGKIEQGSYFDLQNTTGTSVDVEEFIIGDGTLTGTFTEALPNDDYTVNWSIISADGHPLEGTFSFTMNAPIPEPVVEEEPAKQPIAEETPATEEQPIAESTPTEEKSSSPVIIIAILVIVIAAVGILLARRKK